MWSLENPAIKNGIIAGIGSAILILLLYVINPKLVLALPSLLTTILFIVMMVYSVRAEKKVGDYMSFNDGLRPAFLTYVIGNLIYFIFSYFLLNFIAPEILGMQKEFMKDFISYFSSLMTPDQYETMIEEIEAQPEPVFTMGTAVWSFLITLIFPGFIFSAIIAAVMKDRRPVDL